MILVNQEIIIQKKFHRIYDTGTLTGDTTSYIIESAKVVKRLERVLMVELEIKQI